MEFTGPWISTSNLSGIKFGNFGKKMLLYFLFISIPLHLIPQWFCSLIWSYHCRCGLGIQNNGCNVYGCLTTPQCCWLSGYAHRYISSYLWLFMWVVIWRSIKRKQLALGRPLNAREEVDSIKTASFSCVEQFSDKGGRTPMRVHWRDLPSCKGFFQ